MQQADIERGISSSKVMREIRSEHGLSALCDDILQGRPVTALETGIITKADYQEMFKAAKERTSSAGEVHYTLWKALAEEDNFAEFLCIMMSLPFMYWFVNHRWHCEVDVMLEKIKRTCGGSTCSVSLVY